MERRALRYSDGKSDKFWRIALEGASHTVCYGRVGTAGQTQMKEFESDAAARKSFEKLVQAKLKKGYTEIQTATEVSESTIELSPVDDSPVDKSPVDKSPVDKSPVDEFKLNQPSVLAKNWPELALSAIQRELKQNKKQLCELAAINAIPDTYLSILNFEVRKAIAQQTCTSIQLLEKLAEDAHDSVRGAVAGNASTPHDCLKMLANDSVQAVRYALARNVYAPASVLRELIEEPYINVVKAACENPNVTEELLEPLSQKLNKHQKHTCRWKQRKAREKRDILESKTSWDRSILVNDWDKAKLPSIQWSELTIEDFEKHEKLRGYQLLIAQDPKTPASLLAELATYDKATLADAHPIMTGCFHRSLIQEAVACNPTTPADSLRKLANTNNLFVCMALARNPALPSDLFVRLFENNNYLYAYTRYGNNQTWKDFETGSGPNYDKYLNDFHWELAKNPSTPTEILEKLTQHKAAYVQEMAKRQSRDRGLKNTESSVETLKKLLKHRDIDVRVAIAQNPKGLPLFLGTFLESSRSLGRFLALMHPDIGQNELAKAISSKEWTDRYAVSQRSNPDKAILSQLVSDENSFVQASAKIALGMEVVVGEVSVDEIEDLSVPVVSKVETTEAPAEPLEVKRSLNLTPEDLQWVSWNPNPSLALPKSSPFDLQSCEDRLSKVAKHKWNWEQAQLSMNMSNDEAYYWISIMLTDGYRAPLALDAENHALMTILEHSLGFTAAPFSKNTTEKLSPALAAPLHTLFGIGKVIQTLVEIASLPESNALAFSQLQLHSIPYNAHFLKGAYDPTYKYYGSGFKGVYSSFTQWVSGMTRLMVEGFAQYIYPYLTDTELEVIAQQISPIFKLEIPQPLRWSLFHMAAFLKLHDVVQQEVESWQKGNYYPCHNHNYYAYWAVETMPSLLLRLYSPDLVKQHMRRLDFIPGNAQEIRLCLATTGFEASDLICKRISKAEKYRHKSLFSEWMNVATAPEMAPYMLELTLASKVAKDAIRWLESNLACAIVGLIPVAANVGPQVAVVKKIELVDAAQRFLLSQVRKGYRSTIEAALKEVPDSVAAKIRTEILEHPDLRTVSLDEKTIPDWLRTAISELPRLTGTAISINASDLPKIIVGNHCLSDQQSQHVLQALKLSTLNSPLALVVAVKAHATVKSLDVFVWSLFERWLAEGGNSKDKWAMHSLGLLGSDEIALKLTPLIRKWPGESQHGKAQFGLECLRAIGTDTALMQISGIAQKIKYKALKQRAQECMADIARDRKFTPEQLEDRIIPHCDLDTKGQRIFDFGARQFQFALGPDLKPFVRDDKGKLKSTLPKPNQKDDAELAQQAIADWNLMKKQISAVVKLQATRLEQAMVTERHWPLSDFQTLLAGHPLMTHLVQRLIWGGHDGQGNLIQTFRVAEDQTLADAADETFDTTHMATVSLPHSLHLSDQVKADWGESLSDYEIIPPFPQLNRETYTLNPEEETAKDITRFQTIKVPAESLVRSLESLGWQRGHTDQGEVSVQCKYFEKANITAIVGEYENVFLGGGTGGNEVIDGCCFVQGNYVPMDYPRDRQWATSMEPVRLRLGDIDPLLMSEVLRDLILVTTVRAE